MSENHSGPIQYHPPSGAGAGVPFHLSQEPLAGQAPSEAVHTNGGTPAPAYEHLGELPVSYGTQSVYLVAYDPRQLFAYWDLDPAGTPANKYSLHICRPDGEIESKVDIHPTEAGRYLAARRPGGTYHVELGTYGRNGAWQPVASSGRVTLPAEGLAGETEPKFATLPFHLSFQRLIELIDGAMGSKEDLTAALARLQRGERPAGSSLLGSLAHLTPEQLHTLEALLGQKFALDSAASTRFGGGARDHGDALAATGGGSESSFARGGGGSEGLTSGGAFGSESLSSGGAFGSESLSSSAFGVETALKPFSSDTLASFSGGTGSEAVSSFSLPLASGSLSSQESLSSLGAGLGNDSLSSYSRLSSETFSFLAGGPGSETLASGGFGGESLLSLLSGMSSESLSSFFAAFAAGGSEDLSSGGAAGLSSEAWRKADSGSGGLSSDILSSDRAAVFLHAVESNLATLSSLFSHSFSNADSSSMFSGNASGGGGLARTASASEGFVRRKSLW